MIKNIIKDHLTKYPYMEVQDIIKLIYQNEFGGGHLVDDQTKSLTRLVNEAKQLPEGTFYSEDIGNGLLRVYLANVSDLELLTLNQIFVYSANLQTGKIESFIQKLDDLKSDCKLDLINLDYEQLCLEIDNYEQLNYPPISHSNVYRTNYKPHYRVVSRVVYSYYPVILKINQLLQEHNYLNIAIDGKCGAGKSTLGKILSTIFDANLFKMDDFFLQPFQRTSSRLKQPGGNVDYERFKETVIEPLSLKQVVKYQRFDCSKMALNKEIELIEYRKINIVEGTYSMHPYFGDFYDFTIALNVTDNEQEKRILKRNGEIMYSKFKKIWIPLENKYFDEYLIFKHADMLHNSNE